MRTAVRAVSINPSDERREGKWGRIVPDKWRLATPRMLSKEKSRQAGSSPPWRISPVRPAPGAPDRLPRAGSRFTATLLDGHLRARSSVPRPAHSSNWDRIGLGLSGWAWALPLWGPENMREDNEQFEGNLDPPDNCRVPKLGVFCLGRECPVGHGPCRAEVPKMRAETMSSSKEISQGPSDRPDSVAPGTRRRPPPQPRALSEDKIPLGFLA